MAAALLTLSACVVEVPLPSVATPERTPEQPREVAVRVVDRVSGEPVERAELDFGAGRATTDTEGTATITVMRGTAVEAVAEGFDPGQGEVPDEGDLLIELRSNTVHGTVTDPARNPIEGVRVFVDGSKTLARTDANGSYRLAGVPEAGTLIYKVPGYRLGEIAIDEAMEKHLVLEPFEARALYAPAVVFEGGGRLDQLLAAIEATEANAIVIDVKEVDGWLYYATDLEAVVEIGAQMEHPILDLQQLLPMLEERGIYTIARMVVMKDNTLGRARPELTVRNTATGGAWTDWGGGIWLDPFKPGVAEYAAAVAGDLGDKGFDEVQLDYIRFYSDGPYDLAETTLPNTQAFRLPAIRHVMRVVGDAFETRRAFLAADAFPASFISLDDQGIGQRPEVIMPLVDYFSPMIYPSHYAPFSFGHEVPNEHPYEIVDQTLEIMNRQAQGLQMRIRPWIQDFGFGPHRKYGVADVQAEIRALRDNGAAGWMLWNAGARFTTGALGPPREGEDHAPITTTAPAPGPSPSPMASPSP